VVGAHKSGKTRTIELLALKLKEKIRVATMKHVHELDFTFDLKGKDTWRHRAAGAGATLALSQSEIALFKKLGSDKPSWGKLVSMLKGYDLVLAEGFRFKAGRRKDVWKIITARSLKEVEEFRGQVSPPILAVVGWAKPLKAKFPSFPVLKLPEEAERLIELIFHRVLKRKKILQLFY
jgi:molybdopterin-guanine dinucleotide biosynthesis protein MobB